MTPTHIAADQTVEVAARALTARLGARSPRVALILGSGLGALTRELEAPVEIPFAEIPGFPTPGVSGHAGVVVAGTLAGCSVLAVAGRFHLYEGHSPATAALPVRVAHAIGARMLFVSNAAGGVRADFRAGDLMLIVDHVNLMFRNPLAGPVRNGEQRFPDMSSPYDAALLAHLREAAAACAIAVREGVYAGLLGPSYETPAEVRMLRVLGADAVGMSTVPEVIAARALGMRVAGVSCITNAATGVEAGAAPLDHADVLAVIAGGAGRFTTLVREFVRRAGPK